MTDRPYIFYELTNGLCRECHQKVEAKILLQKERVYMQKFCPSHGVQKVLISTDIEFYLQTRQMLKPGQMPLAFNTQMEKGCPFDCGLCPDHEQHSCLTVLEVTDQCNLTCPICYADSSPRQKHRPLEQVIAMLDRIVLNEGEPDVVQISGGEPTIHPDFFAILDAARERPIRHLMVNTNGIRIARDAAFAERLASYMPAFEIYLQFDSLHEEAIIELRGQPLKELRMKALERLNALGISTTLVVTLKKGLNDHEIGDLIAFALQQPCVRGVTFQPIQEAGRFEDYDTTQDRLTLSEVRSQILAQSDLFQAEDILPVPCHPECIAMAYALKYQGQTVPLTHLIDPQKKGNTIRYEEFIRLFSTAHSPQSAAKLLCCLPDIPLPENLGYQNLFRIIIMRFMDVEDMDIRSVKRSCVHMVTPDAQRMIPFDTYNLFYREKAEEALPVKA
jgi:uncharacterized radical SAM superfamily Fe-S cluster-containing enzyme